MECIFCQIINKKLPAEIIYEDEKVLVFKDIKPKASFHYLIVPKEHIASISTQGSELKVGDLIRTAKEIAQKEKVDGYKLVFNVGKEGGQLIEHLHLHFLAGRKIELP